MFGPVLGWINLWLNWSLIGSILVGTNPYTSYYPVILVIHLVHEWNIVIFPEFNEFKLVFHEAQLRGIQDFHELNEGNMTIFHEWTK